MLRTSSVEIRVLEAMAFGFDLSLTTGSVIPNVIF